MSNWISIADHLPQKKGLYLVFAEPFHIMVEEFDVNENSFMMLDDVCGKAFPSTTVTHWMPLPDRP